MKIHHDSLITTQSLHLKNLWLRFESPHWEMEDISETKLTRIIFGWVLWARHVDIWVVTMVTVWSCAVAMVTVWWTLVAMVAKCMVVMVTKFLIVMVIVSDGVKEICRASTTVFCVVSCLGLRNIQNTYVGIYFIELLHGFTLKTHYMSECKISSQLHRKI